ncbi:ETS homologous factor-like [Eriocheir sinensis]|uniref:ETS homologous factor-like n=1 Tax=Eriocheir sinensis TaxID=95602 RepID=UPI0021CAE0FA|nr:ETS homologous factor-like [Eriocheir sinensis]
MDSHSYEDIKPSFTLNESPFLSDSTIDSLCETYLGNMNSFTAPLPPSSSSSSYSSSSYASSFTSSSPLSPFDGECSLLEEMEAFSRIDVWEWRGEDTLDWAGSVCRRRGLDTHTVDLTHFRHTAGSHLQQMTQADFSDLVGGVYGPLFFAEFQDLCRKREEGKKWRQQCGGSSPYSDCGNFDLDFDLKSEFGSDLGDLDLTSEDIRDLDRYILDPNDPSLVGGMQDMDLGASSLGYDSIDSCPESVAQLSAASSSPSSLSPIPFSSSSSSSPSPSSSNHLAPPDPLKKIRADPKKRERGPRNWEFVIRLLADPRSNPSLIRWEQKDQGVFRLVQPAVIASMWGKRSDRPNLSYDNFARGLRYHYTTGALQPVSEKQLVYRCGPKALRYLIDLSRGACQ